MIKMVVFDMAGTTVNENNVVYKTVHQAIAYAGYHVSFEQVLANGAGKEKLQAVKDILRIDLGIDDETLAEGIHKNFVAMLEKAYENLDVQPEVGAEQVFIALKNKGIYVVLNTGYDAKTARSLLVKLGWVEGEQIDLLVTASDVPNNRPKPDMIQFAMRHFGIEDGKQVAKVGDSSIDIEEGLNAGCGLSIGVTTGAHTREQLEAVNPDYIIDGLDELVGIVERK
jgi:phosphonatase-like hydrolase